jgi:hypothetical protein
VSHRRRHGDVLGGVGGVGGGGVVGAARCVPGRGLGGQWRGDRDERGEGACEAHGHDSRWRETCHCGGGASGDLGGCPNY